MQRPVLVVMAAGLGSRYGGLKQIAPVDDRGHILIDFSIYDAVRAGFSKIVCVIKEEAEREFREVIGRRLESDVRLEYAYQRLTTLPEGFSVPEGRTRPWGTAHAVLCAAPFIDGPFGVINADDFYGREAFDSIYAFLRQDRKDNEHAMVGYLLRNTLTENGHVARGVCGVDEAGYLTGIIERTHIERRGNDAVFTEDNGRTYTFLPGDATVSMNLWGFQRAILDEFQDAFAGYLKENLPKNPLACEYFITLAPDAQVREGRGTVKVLRTDARWHGVTYREDMPVVQAAIAKLKAEGAYPDYLWKEERP